MIHLDTISFPAASMGVPNPLPDIHNNSYIHATCTVSDEVSPEERANIGKGMIPTILPYLMQDGYDRNRKITDFPAIILENRYLKAVFLPTLGGRLWQLYDKEQARDLLYVNPVFQPCNLALRNAWFSGGIEFNVGIKGHNPLTCETLFAQKQTTPDMEEILSMYEYERIRGIVYSVNAWLPEDSRVLYLKNTIENTAVSDVYTYWWTNIAVPQTTATRVIVPAHDALLNCYQEDHYVLGKTTYPHTLETDASYPNNLPRSLDFFYKIPQAHSKWIASVEADGNGFLHFSQDRLLGRKLFLWGHGNGGRHWGEFLAGAQDGSGEGYIEIQAGLAHTQLEHFMLPAQTRLEWVECCGAIHGDCKALFGDWDTAIAETERCLAKITNGQTPEAWLKDRFPSFSGCRVEHLFAGSGWGRLENRVRAKLGAPPISALFAEWGESATPETAPWEALLDSGRFPNEDALLPPVSYCVDHRCTGRFWADTLQDAVAQGDANGVGWNQLGVIWYAAGRGAEAKTAWQKAAALQNPWAMRNLANWYANEQHDTVLGTVWMEKAVAIVKNNRSLAVDCGNLLCNAGAFERFLSLYPSFMPAIQSDGRMRLLKAKALLALDRLSEAAEIINADFTMPDIKEGELSISALWFILHEKELIQEGFAPEAAAKEAPRRFPLPYALDFRMHE